MASAEEKMTLRERVTKDEPKKDEEKSDDEVQIVEKSDSGDQEKTKKRKKDRRRLKYDAEGIHILSKQDLCDCLDLTCPGCHFPCKKCSSLKCGHICRRNRKWEYEMIEIQGTNMCIKRQHPPIPKK